MILIAISSLLLMLDSPLKDPETMGGFQGLQRRKACPGLRLRSGFASKCSFVSKCMERLRKLDLDEVKIRVSIVSSASNSEPRIWPLAVFAT